MVNQTIFVAHSDKNSFFCKEKNMNNFDFKNDFRCLDTFVTA